MEFSTNSRDLPHYFRPFQTISTNSRASAVTAATGDAPCLGSAPHDKPGVIRLFLHGDATAIDWIKLTTAGKTRRWEF